MSEDSGAAKDRRLELTRAIQGEAPGELAALASYAADLRDSSAACERILSSHPNVLDHATMEMLYVYAMISYARCFSGGVRTKLQLDLDQILDEDAKEFHEHVLMVRDKHLAHSVSPFETVIPLCVLSDPEKGAVDVEEVSTVRLTAAWNLNTQVPKLLAVTKVLLVAIDFETLRLQGEILKTLRRGDIQALYDQQPITFIGEGAVGFAEKRRPNPGAHPAGKSWRLPAEAGGIFG